MEKLLDEESQRVQEARTHLAKLNMERAAAANETARARKFARRGVPRPAGKMSRVKNTRGKTPSLR